ncbi:MAG TPA: divergent polysaccharide deacetylase family protein [Geothrix sp.]|uniref:divergent polysaccharide deacetylase family protein n=1 Tax=Geothrix mesophila TaxID=2922723 RepID=UPI001FAC0C36|nr:divergent polysaccharide deacetylase family protein [Geothrix sp. SG198]HJV39094.1 divergent polysaccharide deacetylase family protein [Geothrix sp.]
MARGKGKRTSTLALLGWGTFTLLLGLGAGLMLGQQACGRRQAPAKREAPAPESRKPERKQAEPKAKPPSETAKPQSPEPERPLPRLALVIDDLGYMQPELVTRLCSLPVPFSVAVLPYQEFTRDSADIAHRLGKEVMLHLPMEPIGYPGPGRDPGPNAILFNLPETEVRRRVRMALDGIPHRAGVNNHMGSRITPDRTRMTWVLQELKARKLFFVDSRTEKDSVAYDVAEELGIPAVQRKVFLDDDKAFPEMEKQWDRALKLAEKDGSVLIIGHIYPETVEALEKLVPRTKGQVRFVKAGDLAK